nr:BLUF domain-containing protein [Hymenobacter cyanobacteriorum]
MFNYFDVKLQQLVYQSKSTIPFSAEQLETLLRPWRMHNHAQRISGLLLYGDDDIIQVIEGPVENVHALYQTIAADARHYDVITLADGPIPERAFAEWSMGFSALDESRREQLAGYVGPNLAGPGTPVHPGQWPELTALLREFAAHQLS